MKITAVVVTFNRLELLRKGIQCLRANKGLTEIIVVNNGSTDGTREWLGQQEGLCVVNQENVGGSGGFYTGIQKAYEEGADWIWCMDDDVFPREDCLQALMRHIDMADVGIVVPRRMLEGRVFTHEFKAYNLSNPFVSLKQGKLAGKDITEATEIAGADFEGPFIRRDVVERIGLPNRELFIFCDDTDYCLRAHLAGFRLVYEPDAILDKHRFFTDDTWAERNRKKKWKRYYQVRNETFLNHHYGRNWAVRHIRAFIRVLGYVIPALLTIPFSKAWQWEDLSTLWTAYQEGLQERLGKRQ